MTKPKPRALNSPWVGFIIKWMAKGNTWIYQRSNGRFGNTFQRLPSRCSPPRAARAVNPG